MAQIQRVKQSRFGQEVWVSGIYLGFGVWNLEFEVNHQGLFPSDLRGVRRYSYEPDFRQSFSHDTSHHPRI
jgi:hypothetical protein